MKRLSLVVLRRQRELPRCARVAPRAAQGSVHAKLNSLISSVRKRVALPERLRLLPMTVGSKRKTQIERALNFQNLQIDPTAVPRRSSRPLLVGEGCYVSYYIQFTFRFNRPFFDELWQSCRVLTEYTQHWSACPRLAHLGEGCLICSTSANCDGGVFTYRPQLAFQTLEVRRTLIVRPVESIGLEHEAGSRGFLPHARCL